MIEKATWDIIFSVMKLRSLDINKVKDTCWLQESEKRLLAAGMQKRVEKASRFRHEKDRLLSLAAGILLLNALEEAGIRDLTLTEEKEGKPRLLKDQGFFFSLSHSGHFAVCAVSDRECGVDVQKPVSYNPGLVSRFFSPEEQSLFADAGEASDRDRLFTRLWTLKEAYVKMLGTGLTTDLGSFAILPGQEETTLMKKAPGYGEVSCSFTETSLEDHLVAVCVSSDDASCHE